MTKKSRDRKTHKYRIVGLQEFVIHHHFSSIRPVGSHVTEASKPEKRNFEKHAQIDNPNKVQKTIKETQKEKEQHVTKYKRTEKCKRFSKVQRGEGTK